MEYVLHIALVLLNLVEALTADISLLLAALNLQLLGLQTLQVLQFEAFRCGANAGDEIDLASVNQRHRADQN